MLLDYHVLDIDASDLVGFDAHVQATEQIDLPVFQGSTEIHDVRFEPLPHRPPVAGHVVHETRGVEQQDDVIAADDREEAVMSLGHPPVVQMTGVRDGVVPLDVVDDVEIAATPAEEVDGSPVGDASGVHDRPGQTPSARLRRVRVDVIFLEVVEDDAEFGPGLAAARVQDGPDEDGGMVPPGDDHVGTSAPAVSAVELPDLVAAFTHSGHEQGVAVLTRTVDRVVVDPARGGIVDLRLRRNWRQDGPSLTVGWLEPDRDHLVLFRAPDAHEAAFEPHCRPDGCLHVRQRDPVCVIIVDDLPDVLDGFNRVAHVRSVTFDLEGHVSDQGCLDVFQRKGRPPDALQKCDHDVIGDEPILDPSEHHIADLNLRPHLKVVLVQQIQQRGQVEVLQTVLVIQIRLDVDRRLELDLVDLTPLFQHRDSQLDLLQVDRAVRFDFLDLQLVGDLDHVDHVLQRQLQVSGVAEAHDLGEHVWINVREFQREEKPAEAHLHDVTTWNDMFRERPVFLARKIPSEKTGIERQDEGVDFEVSSLFLASDDDVRVCIRIRKNEILRRMFLHAYISVSGFATLVRRQDVHAILRVNFGIAGLIQTPDSFAQLLRPTFPRIDAPAQLYQFFRRIGLVGIRCQLPVLFQFSLKHLETSNDDLLRVRLAVDGVHGASDVRDRLLERDVGLEQVEFLEGYLRVVQLVDLVHVVRQEHVPDGVRRARVEI